MTNVAIIGGGLAGTSCAYVLLQAGATPIIYEASPSLASGASGNPIGLYNPRFSAHRTPQSDYYASGFSQILQTVPNLGDVRWEKCGSLHLITDEKRAKRFPETLKNWDWDFDHMRLLSADEVSDVAGVAVGYDALYLPDAGYLSPQMLCDVYAENVEIKLDTYVDSLPDIEADAVILACGMGVQHFPEGADLPVSSVRGQLTQVKANEETRKLKCNLCYGGYFSPANDDMHALGATFQRWLDHDNLMNEDDEDNLAKLADVMPDLAKGLEIVGQRAALRTTSKDHFPIVGPVPTQDSLYVSAAHGSHGIISTLAAAHLLADMILDRPRSQPKATIEALSPLRFL